MSYHSRCITGEVQGSQCQSAAAGYAALLSGQPAGTSPRCVGPSPFACWRLTHGNFKAGRDPSHVWQQFR